MTEREQIEKELLMDIVLESSKWRLSEGDDRDCIRLEVEQRLGKYMGISPEVVDGCEQSVVERGLARQQAKNKQSYHGHSNHVRVYVDGKPKWFPKDLCIQVPFAKSRTGYKWSLKTEVQNEPTDRT